MAARPSRYREIPCGTGGLETSPCVNCEGRFVRNWIMGIIRRVESDRHLLGLSTYIIAVGHR